MKKIKDFQAGDDASLYLRLHDVQIKKTTAGADYATMLGFDGIDTIEVKIWAFSQEIKDLLVAGEVYLTRGKMKDYQGKMQFNIVEIKLASPSEIELSDFYEYAKVDANYIKEAINKYVNEIKNNDLKRITQAVLEKHEKTYFLYPAAVNMHHNYYYGLAYHTYSMLLLSEAYLKLYPFLNRDLVIAGIILHDLGKVIELSGPKGTEYTKEGKLLGHITLGTSEVLQTASKLGLEKTEAALALAHIVLSHHDQADFGSPKEPTIPEAILVHFLDINDAKLAALEKEVLKTPPGEYTSPILIFERRSFYIPNLDNK